MYVCFLCFCVFVVGRMLMYLCFVVCDVVCFLVAGCYGCVMWLRLLLFRCFFLFCVFVMFSVVFGGVVVFLFGLVCFACLFVL